MSGLFNLRGSRLFTPRRSKDVDMTQGSIIRHIIAFAIPLLMGNLFQQLYNMVDTWVVGRYVGNTAFSAVGTLGPVTNLLIGFFGGLASGAGVVISQYYGAQRHDRVQDAVHTAIMMTLIMAAAFTAIGMCMVPLMLRLIKMPADVIPEATAYLRIYFAGISGLMIYNMGAGILRAIGDSQRPFYFLVVCATMNIILDLLLVLKFNMGVVGVALATVLSQAVSAVLVLFTLIRTDSCIKLRFSKLRLHFDMLGKIVKVGIPAAIQMAITSFSNIFVQSYINFFGTDCMSGWTAYAKIDQLLFLPMQSIALASTTFVGQNLGCNQVDRAKKGVQTSLIIGIVSVVIMMIPIMLFAEHIVAFFNTKAEVVEFGSLFLRWLTPFYILCCFNQIYTAALRGAGNTRAPMVILLSGFVVFRQIYLFFMSRICNEIIPIAMSYPAGWLICSLATTIYFYKVKLGKTRLVEDE